MHGLYKNCEKMTYWISTELQNIVQHQINKIIYEIKVNPNLNIKKKT